MILKKKTGKVSDMSYKLSKSKINDYLQCPRKFRYRYIDEIKVPQNIYFKMGSDVHQIAEDFINIWKRDNSIDILKTLLELEAPYEGDYKRHCIHMASFFTEKLIDEEYDVFSAEEYLLSERYNFSGLADIVLEKDGELTVIDYKSGRSHTVKKYVTELCYYKMLIEDKYPDKLVRYAGIFFTKDGKYSELMFDDDNKNAIICTQSEYESKIELMYEIREKIEKKEFTPNRQFLCKYCDFKKYCDAEGFITLDDF